MHNTDSLKKLTIKKNKFLVENRTLNNYNFVIKLKTKKENNDLTHIFCRENQNMLVK